MASPFAMLGRESVCFPRTQPVRLTSVNRTSRLPGSGGTATVVHEGTEGLARDLTRSQRPHRLTAGNSKGATGGLCLGCRCLRGTGTVCGSHRPPRGEVRWPGAPKGPPEVDTVLRPYHPARGTSARVGGKGPYPTLTQLRTVRSRAYGPESRERHNVRPTGEEAMAFTRSCARNEQ